MMKPSVPFDAEPPRVPHLPTVYLVDDEEVVRDAIGWLLRSRRLLSEGFPSAEAFLAMLDQRDNVLPDGPRCLLLDIRMSGQTGTALFDMLHERDLVRHMPVIFLTGQGDIPTAVDALKRGAFDFVEKPFSNNGLLDRVEAALQQSRTTLDGAFARRTARARLERLTPRERDVLDCIVLGRPNKLIADQLGLSVRTVEVHRAHVFEKLRVHSAVELTNLLRDIQSG